jgi:hypothetical protein
MFKNRVINMIIWESIFVNYSDTRRRLKIQGKSDKAQKAFIKSQLESSISNITINVL